MRRFNWPCPRDSAGWRRPRNRDWSLWKWGPFQALSGLSWLCLFVKLKVDFLAKNPMSRVNIPLHQRHSPFFMEATRAKAPSATDRYYQRPGARHERKPVAPFPEGPQPCPLLFWSCSQAESQEVGKLCCPLSIKCAAFSGWVRLGMIKCSHVP